MTVEPDASALLARIREKILGTRAGLPGGALCVTLAFAQSLDGCIAAGPGERTEIDCAGARRFSHALRALHDAIAIGVNTLLVDDPRLNVRDATGPDPRPVVIDSRLRTPTTAQLFRRASSFPIVATTDAACPERVRVLEAAGAEVVRVASDGQGRVDLAGLFAALARRGIGSVMVEGGARIITSVLTGRHARQVVVTVSPDLLGGVRAVEPLGRIPAPLRPK